MMKGKRYASIWVFVLIAVYVVFRVVSSGQQDKPVISNKQSKVEYKAGLDCSRPLVLTKHAKCRMACRDISYDEINQIVKNGNINTGKSELNTENPKYAVEGVSHDGQHIRIILAPQKQNLVVVSCIDLDKEWACDCD